MIAYNEQELIYLYHLGSMRAYEILLSEYRKFIYAYANRYDSGIEYSEDSLQEMMISLSHAFEAYRIDKNTSMRTYFFYVIKSSLSTKKRMVYRKIRYLDDKKKISLDQNIYGTSIKVENVIADTKKTYRPECQLEIQNREQISLVDIMKEKVILVCSECLSRNYTMTKNKRLNVNRLELNKYCKRCGKHTLHKETK